MSRLLEWESGESGNKIALRAHGSMFDLVGCMVFPGAVRGLKESVVPSPGLAKHLSIPGHFVTLRLKPVRLKVQSVKRKQHMHSSLTFPFSSGFWDYWFDSVKGHTYVPRWNWESEAIYSICFINTQCIDLTVNVKLQRENTSLQNKCPGHDTVVQVWIIYYF